MTPIDMQKVVTEIAAAIEKAAWSATWSRAGRPELPIKTESYSAEADGWRLLVVAWPIEGTKLEGIDGSAMKEHTMVHLTPALARRGVELARKQVQP